MEGEFFCKNTVFLLLFCDCDFVAQRPKKSCLVVLEGLGLVTLAVAASAGNFGTAGGDVGLGVLARAAGSTEVLLGVAAGVLATEEEGVLAGGGDGGELVEGDAFTAGAFNALAGFAGEAEGADADLTELDKADVVEDVTDDDGDGSLSLGGVLPDGLALQDDGKAGKGDGGAVATALEEALVDGLVEGGLGAGGQELVKLDEELDVRVGSVGGATDEVLGLLDTVDINTHVCSEVCWFFWFLFF